MKEKEAFNYLTAREHMAPPAVLTLQNRARLHVSPWKNLTQLLLYQTSLPGACHSTAVSCTQLCSCSLNHPVLLAAPVEHSEMLCRPEAAVNKLDWKTAEKTMLVYKWAQVSASSFSAGLVFGCSISLLAQSSTAGEEGEGRLSYSIQLKYWGK